MLPVWTCLENDRAPIAGNPQTKEVLRNSITEFLNSYHLYFYAFGCTVCILIYFEIRGKNMFVFFLMVKV
jgi:hypothetical protein